MKKLIFLLFVFSFLSCVDKNKELSGITDNTKTIGGIEIVIVEYDGCEYIKAYYKFAHKGNCKNKIHCYNEID